MIRFSLCAIAVVAALALLPAARQCDGADEFPWIDPEPAGGAVVFFAGSELDPAVRKSCVEIAKDGEPTFVDLASRIGGEEKLLVRPSELPAAIVAVGPLDDPQRKRLAGTLAEHRDCVGIAVDPGTALLVSGRQIRVLGNGSVALVLAASSGRPLRAIELKNGGRHDWTMLRRAAQERRLADFPSQAPPSPVVEGGSLVIVGGGGLPREITDKFIELAGGPDAPIVVLPIAAEGSLPQDESRDTRSLTQAGAKNVKSLRLRERSEVESPEFAAVLKEAKGVWFNGGRQWRFVDAYMGTKAEELFRDVLRRGGVIGGSSAGASIQSQYMPRGSPLGNTDMMADGYERGLGFLPGVAVDQHFTQRRRHADMTSLMRRYPQLLGIGLDEATAIVVRGSTAETIGRGNVHYYDYRAGPPGGERDFLLAPAGTKFDLVERKLMQSP